MANSWHVDWLKEGVRPWNKRRKKVAFTPDLQGLNFFEILPIDFRETPKTSRFFEGINLSGANLQQANLSNLNFRRANFNASNMSNTQLDASNFELAKFNNTILNGASAKRSIFINAVFTKSDLTDVDFQEADGKDAEFIETTLSTKQAGDFGASSGIKVIPSTFEYQTLRSLRATKDRDFAPNTRQLDEALKVNKYDVFYGTNRKPKIVLGELVDYGDAFDNFIHYGVCEVIIPRSHKIGSLGSPRWKRVVAGVDDRLRLHQIIGLSPDLYWSHINSISKRMKEKEKPTIFVHGFNTNFRDAVIRAAQIGNDLGIGQGIGLFSWPSGGSFNKYAADEAVVEPSKYLLADFIQAFVEKSEQNSVNIIAHSMGCRCLMGAVEELSRKRRRIIKSINQIILAAADVDARSMDFLAPHIVTNCKRTTSYVAMQDDALRVSGWLHNFPRVGLVPPTYVLKGMDTILVNSSDLGSFGHGYVASSRTILSDIHYLLKNNTDPSDRHSVEFIDSDGLRYWKIRE